MSDRVVRALACDEAVRLIAVDATEASRHAAEAHGLGAGGARLAGEITVAALLMGAHVKGEERITLQLQSENPRCSAVAEVDAEGSVRTRVSPPDLHVAERLSGLMLAIKSDAERELYRGFSEVRDQPLADALAAHLATSAQVHGRLAIRVDVDDAGQIGFAGGVLVERLPEEAERPSISSDAFQERFAYLGPDDVEDALHGLVADELAMILRETPVQFKCRCSLDKVEAMLQSLGPTAVRAMRDEDGGAEVVCHFCATKYTISADRLGELAMAPHAEA